MPARWNRFGDDPECHGWAWKSWRIWRTHRQQYIAAHICRADGGAVFDTLRKARAWCELYERILNLPVVQAPERLDQLNRLQRLEAELIEIALETGIFLGPKTEVLAFVDQAIAMGNERARHLRTLAETIGHDIERRQ